MSRKLNPLDLLWIAPLVLCGLMGAALHRVEQPLATYAPGPDYLERPGFLIGRPDWTGCARWTLERIDRDSLHGPGDRSRSHWHASPDALPERHARPADYDGSGLSRGHLAAAANHARTQAEMDATHDLANAVPQDQACNAGIWSRIEARARDLAEAGATVWAITCPCWLPQSQTTHRDGRQVQSLIVRRIGPDAIAVPTHLAKSLLIESDGRRRIETYLVANSAALAGEPIESFRISTDELERIICCDLWAALPDAIEADLERDAGREN